MTAKTLTAADVRTYFRGDAKRMARLSAEAQHTVQPGARGKVHPEAIKVFNTKRRKDRRYVPSAAAAANVRPSRAALRERARAAGIKVADRGRLPKAVLALAK